MNNVEKGQKGEKLASLYLRLHLYKILDRNYRAKTGEIDIVAKKGTYIVFVEVKYRTSVNKGYPREAVTPFKQNQIRRTAMVYLMDKNLTDYDVRFDVIEIIGNNIEHIKNAFW